MILLVGGEKGGTGKSTLATNLAAWLALKGKDVLMLDADIQGTAAAWANERSNHPLPAVYCVQRHDNLFHAVKDLSQRYGEIIIDAGGRDSEELRTAMACADAILSPLKASQSDLWTVEHMAKLIGMARALNQKLVPYMLITMAPTNPRVTELYDAKEMLSGLEDIQLAKAIIHERKVYRDAMFEGKGVVELSDAKATSEIETLATEVYDGKI